MTDKKAIELGYDRRGPGKNLTNRGFSCYCLWSSSYHGDVCPEHGRKGKPITRKRKAK